MELLPVPRVQDLTALTTIVEPIGLDEVGTILLSEVSGYYTDDQLRFLDPTGEPMDPGAEVFYEIEFPKKGKTSVKRRFFMRSAPFYDAGRFQWQIRLEKAVEDRDRWGDYQ